MVTRADVLADVMVALGYREDVEAIVTDVVAEHGRVRLADLEVGVFAAITARHAH